MNRRGFLSLLGKAALGVTVAQTVPVEVLPTIEIQPTVLVKDILVATRDVIYPKMIEDVFFTETPFLRYLRSHYSQPIDTSSSFTSEVFKANV